MERLDVFDELYTPRSYEWIAEEQAKEVFQA